MGDCCHAMSRLSPLGAIMGSVSCLRTLQHAESRSWDFNRQLSRNQLERSVFGNKPAVPDFTFPIATSWSETDLRDNRQRASAARATSFAGCAAADC